MQKCMQRVAGGKMHAAPACALTRARASRCRGAGCDVWFHGACVGLHAELSARQGVEAAFRRYICPQCTHHRAGTEGEGWVGSARKPSAAAMPTALESQAAAATPATHVPPASPMSEKRRGKQPVTSASACAADGALPAPSAPLSPSGSAGSAGAAASTCAPPTASVAAVAETLPQQPVAAPCLLLSILSEDCLFVALGRLPLATLLLTVAPASRRLAALAEPHFQLACERHGWRPLRRARDHPFAWRGVLRQRACAVCIGSDAHFPVRRGSAGVTGGVPLFRLCTACAKRDKVQQQIFRHGFEVDAIGEHGKALYARQFHMPLFGHANGFSSDLDRQVKRTGL